jgi:hypothetical protein
LLQLVVELRQSLIGLAQFEARADRLHAQVIFLIEHQAERLAAFDHRGRTIATRGVFAGNQVAFDQHLLLHGIQAGELLREAVLHRGERFDRRAQDFQRGTALIAGRPTGKRHVTKIARETDARREHDAVIGIRADHPVGRILEQRGKTHHGWKR